MLFDQLPEQWRNVPSGYSIVQVHVAQGEIWQRWVRCVGRVLHERQSAASLNRLQSGHAIVQLAAEKYADDTCRVFDCGGSEQHIYGRPPNVFRGAWAPNGGKLVGV